MRPQNRACREEPSTDRAEGVNGKRATVAIGEFNFARVIGVGHHHRADMTKAQKQWSTALEVLRSHVVQQGDHIMHFDFTDHGSEAKRRFGTSSVTLTGELQHRGAGVDGAPESRLECIADNFRQGGSLGEALVQ
jgi:hypothetical protein